MQSAARNHAHACLITAIFLCCVPHINGQNKTQQLPLIKADVVTVFAKVSVSDPLNRYVTGLGRNDFKLYEDNVEQTVSHFVQESAPISVGVIFDISGSMAPNIENAKNEISRFLETSRPSDEYFLITFDESINLVQAFTDDSAALKRDIIFQQANGSTALFDAVYRGLDLIRAGKNEKKALIVITDGEDNSSHYKLDDIREFSRESDAQIYGIGLSGPVGYGQEVIERITGVSGGRAFFTENFSDLDYWIGLIHTELRNQYLLGYVPKNKVHDGKWRKIRVELDRRLGLKKLSVRARSGYYASRD